MVLSSVHLINGPKVFSRQLGFSIPQKTAVPIWHHCALAGGGESDLSVLLGTKQRKNSHPRMAVEIGRFQSQQ